MTDADCQTAGYVPLLLWLQNSYLYLVQMSHPYNFNQIYSTECLIHCFIAPKCFMDE